MKQGVVIQQGIAKMVCLVLIKDSPKDAFIELINPLTKITQLYLPHLPEGLFDHQSPSAGLFFDSEYLYLSLNIYFGENKWEGCPKLYYSKTKNIFCQ